MPPVHRHPTLLLLMGTIPPTVSWTLVSIDKAHDCLGLLYNLYGDAELNLGLVSQDIYTQQAAFYDTVFNTYGVPLDTRHTYTKGDWEIFTAAISGSSDAQSKFISALATWINSTPTNLALTDWYDTESGE